MLTAGPTGRTVAEIAASLDEYYVSVDPRAKTRCIDGRHDPALDESALGPQVPGGAPGSALAYRLGVDKDDLTRGTFTGDAEMMIEAYLRLGLSPGGHRDDAEGDGVGCGAIDGLQSGSGDLSIEAYTVSLSATTGSGDVTIASADQPCQVKAGSGDVLVHGSAADLDVGTGSGDVTLASVAGGRVRVRAGSGDLRVAVQDGIPVWTQVSALGDVTNRLTPRGTPQDGQGHVELRAQVGADLAAQRCRDVGGARDRGDRHDEEDHPVADDRHQSRPDGHREGLRRAHDDLDSHRRSAHDLLRGALLEQGREPDEERGQGQADDRAVGEHRGGLGMGIRGGELEDPKLVSEDIVVVKRQESRVVLRDSVIGDVINIVNPFNYLPRF